MHFSTSFTSAFLPISYGLQLSGGIYINDDSGNKSFLINKYIYFKMNDSKPVIDQVNELNDIVSQCTDVGELILRLFKCPI